MKKRREEAKEKMKTMLEHPEKFTSTQSSKVERMTPEQIQSLKEDIERHVDPNLEQKQHRWLRNRNYSSKNEYNPYDLNNLADPGAYYSEWAQAYRMLGAFISCDNGGVGYYGGRNNEGCSRWIMWAAVSILNCWLTGKNICCHFHLSEILNIQIPY